MRKVVLYPIISFAVVLLSHAAYSIQSAYSIAKKWASIEEVSYLASYLKEGDYFLSMSYASAAAFLVYAFVKMYENKKKGAVGVASGVTLMGFLYFGVCFLLGCCGSPMLVVYIGLFGPKFLGFTKPLMFIITIISIVIGIIWLEKRSKKCINGECFTGSDKDKGVE
jgi:hypothetical protein